MNKFAFFAAFLSFLAAAPAFSAPLIGQPAPAFTGTDSAGNKISLADFKGKTVVLEWTNKDCPFVRKHYDSGNMQKLQKEAVANGAVWLTIGSSAEGKQGHIEGPAVTEWLTKEQASPTAYLVDKSGEIGKLYGAKATPTMFVIDKNGTLVYGGAIDSIASVDKGDIPKAKNYVYAALVSLQAGTPVTEPVTTAYGCGVKYKE